MLGQEIEATAIVHEKSFSEKCNGIGSNILQQNEVSITKGLVFGNEKLESDQKKSLLVVTNYFIPWKDFKSHNFKNRSADQVVTIQYHFNRNIK